MIYIFDFEVTAYDWLLVAKELDSDDYFIAHNDNDSVKEFIENLRPLLGGFNNKHYDQFILKAILADATPEQVKEINDYIIVEGHNGWEHPIIKESRCYFDQFDLKDDCEQGVSLKSFEAHMGMNIVESSVDFNIDRPLTNDELQEMIRYCKYDVQATEKLYHIRESYLNNKEYLGGLKGIPKSKALYMTNAKLTAAYLGAEAKEHNDERKYVFPKNILWEYIPDYVYEFFDEIHDSNIPDEDFFKRKLDFTIGECECTVGMGGIHGAIPHYRERCKLHRYIRNLDVSSYYPHLMTIDGYCSRSIANPQMYADMLERRMAAKKSGDKVTANALKLVANTTYGAMLNQYNDLYDPLMGRSVCITGQLRLLELAFHLVSDCPTLKVIQLNTDGIMVSLDDTDFEKYRAIYHEWEDRTGFELEEDNIVEIIQANVNNYIEVPKSGNPKIKGGVLVRGIAPAGAFKVNNNATIVSKAIVDYFVDNLPVEQTINDCTDILAFQLIAKASSKYLGMFHIIGEDRVQVQRCNRVYATDNTLYGTLYKNRKDGGVIKVAGLPEHCLIDNDNHLKIEEIDRKWYIDLANKYIKDFLGEKEPRTTRRNTNMATAKAKTEKPKNITGIYAKLVEIRKDFANSEVSKSGKNIHAEFDYFELSDIIPVASEILAKYNTVFVTTFPSGQALGRLVDLDDSNEIQFVFDTVHIKEPAKFRMNEAQACGAEQTYYRRYLYYQLLDIDPKDTFDGGAKAPTPLPLTQASQHKKPATTEERADVKKSLTATDEQADELQIDALKKALKELKKQDPSQESFIASVILKTNKFTKITRSECEKILLAVNKQLAVYRTKEEDAIWNGQPTEQ